MKGEEHKTKNKNKITKKMDRQGCLETEQCCSLISHILFSFYALFYFKISELFPSF